jgi:hypothetical protein
MTSYTLMEFDSFTNPYSTHHCNGGLPDEGPGASAKDQLL